MARLPLPKVRLLRAFGENLVVGVSALRILWTDSLPGSLQARSEIYRNLSSLSLNEYCTPSD